MSSTVKSLSLNFPHGITVAQARELADVARTISGAGISVGGFAILNMVEFMGGGPLETDERAMNFVYGYKRKPEPKIPDPCPIEGHESERPAPLEPSSNPAKPLKTPKRRSSWETAPCGPEVLPQSDYEDKN